MREDFFRDNIAPYRASSIISPQFRCASRVPLLLARTVHWLVHAVAM